jgi:hypothetical protein
MLSLATSHRALGNKNPTSIPFVQSKGQADGSREGRKLPTTIRPLQQRIIGDSEHELPMYASAGRPQPHVSAHLASPPVDHSTVSLPFLPCSSKNIGVRFGGYKNHAARARRRKVAVAADMSAAGERSATHPLPFPCTDAAFPGPLLFLASCLLACVLPCLNP